MLGFVISDLSSGKPESALWSLPETPRALPSFKPKEVQDPEPFTDIQTNVKRFTNQLALVLAAVGRFTDIQHQRCYCFSLLKGDAYTFMEPY